MSLPPSEPYQAEDDFLNLARAILKHTPFTLLLLTFTASIALEKNPGYALVTDFAFWYFFIFAHLPLLILVHTGRNRWKKELYACPIVVVSTLLEWVYVESIPDSDSNLAWGSFLLYGLLKVPVCFLGDLFLVAVFFWASQRWDQRNAKPDAPRQEHST